MNYLTAIIALPLFIAIFVFEIYLAKKGKIPHAGAGKNIIKVCLVVSFLQMLSCFFWFFGFVFSTTDDVMSEAMRPHEEMNCFGLVGAEVILAVFQTIFSMLSVYLAVCTRGILLNIKTLTMRATDTPSKVVLGISAVVLSVYIVFAWFTAYNRRCPQGATIFPEFQHHFYPVYLVFDSVFAIHTFLTAKKIQAHARGSMTTTAGASVSVSVASELTRKNSESQEQRTTETASGVARKKKKSLEAVIYQLVQIYKLQAQITIVTASLAVAVFVLQYSLDLKFLSLIACFFCVTMYVTYALRRVTLVAMYVGFDLRRFSFVELKTSKSSTTSQSRSAPTKERRKSGSRGLKLSPSRISTAGQASKSKILTALAENSQAEIDGLKSQIEALQRQLKLAADAGSSSDEVKLDVVVHASANREVEVLA